MNPIPLKFSCWHFAVSISVFFIFFFTPAFSQLSTAPQKDAQLWENINANKKLTPTLTARFSHEGRFTENCSQFTYFFEDIGLEYKIHKLHLGILLDYVFIRKNVQPNWWSYRHQYYSALTWSHKIFGNFEIHDRFMVMGQVKDVHSSVSGKIPDWYLRDKLTLKYTFNFYWSVYLSDELYIHESNPAPDAPPAFNRNRFFIGGYYDLDIHNEFEVYYLFESHLNNVNAKAGSITGSFNFTNFVIGIGYEYSFK